MAKGIRWTEEDLKEHAARRARPARKPADVKLTFERAVAPKKPNKHITRLEQQLQAFPPFVPEYFAIPGRDFRLDYAWPKRKVGIEVQGVHHREKGKFARDIEKRALLLIAGWRVLELDGKSIKEELSVGWLKALL